MLSASVGLASRMIASAAGEAAGHAVSVSSRRHGISSAGPVVTPSIVDEATAAVSPPSVSRVQPRRSSVARCLARAESLSSASSERRPSPKGCKGVSC